MPRFWFYISSRYLPDLTLKYRATMGRSATPVSQVARHRKIMTQRENNSFRDLR